MCSNIRRAMMVETPIYLVQLESSIHSINVLKPEPIHGTAINKF